MKTCSPCKYSTDRRDNYDRHCQTLKHKKAISKPIELLDDKQALIKEKERLQTENECLRKQIESLNKLVSTLAMKPTTVNTINNNIVLQPVVISEWERGDLFNELVSLDMLLKRGILGFYDNLFTKLFVNEDQSLKIKCVNKRKRVFEYQNEDGTLVRDEKLQRFIDSYVHYLGSRLRGLRWEIGRNLDDPKRSIKMQRAVQLELPSPNFTKFVTTKI